jgi:NADH:ubiquinone oxidoreductase subunit 2 (subunit N)
MIAVGCGVLLLPLVHVLLERTPALLGRPLTREARGTYLAVLTAFFLTAGLILTLASFGERREFDPASPLLSLDPVTAFLNTSVLIAALLTVLGSSKFLADVRSNHGEYYTLILSSVTGMLFMTAATNLLLLFLSLELMSIPVYALVALRRDSMHAGEGALKYFLIGSFASAVLFYLLVYVFMTLGGFAVVATLARDGDERDRVDDLAGLIHSQPLAAITLALCAFSLLGLPGTAGFIGKLRLFGSAVERGLATGDTALVVLVVVAVLNTAVSAVYYLRLPAVMFMSARAAGSPEPSAPGSLERIVLWVCAAAILALGILPHDLFVGGPPIDALALAELAAAALN